MSRRSERYQKRLLQLYQNSETVEAADGSRETGLNPVQREAVTTGLWAKQYDTTLYFTRNFVADPSTPRRGVVGFAVRTIKRFFRKGTKYIVDQLTDRIFLFQSKCMELVGAVIQALGDLNARQNLFQENANDLSSELTAIREALEATNELLASRNSEYDNQLKQLNNTLKDHYTRNAEAFRSTAERIAGLENISAAQAEEITELEKTSAAQAEEITELEKTSAAQAETQRGICEEQNNSARIVSAAARDLIRTKWQLRDYMESLRDESDRELTCGICGYHAPERSFETKETDCIFAGGHLLRFVCPSCGCIFGPTKFSDQTDSEFDDDYVVHYAGFRENDATYKERFAFELLHPRKDETYLNYGCGIWSATISQLRQEGYNVFGYEPYAAGSGDPYVITDKTELETMRFDGIFSNDLLEHLRDPIAELSFMRSLLRTPESKMSHCTGCYLYKYEYTRFHMFFFTGESTRNMAEKAGLEIDAYAREPVTKDPCYVFCPVNPDFDVTRRMRSSCETQPEMGVQAGPEQVIFGPYLTLPKDTYHFRLDLKLPKELTEVVCTVTKEKGKGKISQLRLKEGRNDCNFTLEQMEHDIEFVIWNPAASGFVVLRQIEMIWGENKIKPSDSENGDGGIT